MTRSERDHRNPLHEVLTGSLLKPAMAAAERAARSGGARVIVVDDEPSVRAVLIASLGEGPYEIREAADGVEALELLREHGADLVLSDLIMPRMAGLELLDEAKKLDPDIAFIILTGAGTMENAIEALRRSADDYLLKPFEVDEVRLSVERALEHRSLILENRMYQEHLEQRVAAQAEEIEQVFLDALITIANAVEARDGYTGGHVERVTRYAVATGRQLGLSTEVLRRIWVGGLLHDLGKIAIPDEILKKPGELTDEEYEVMKSHPLISASIVERSPYLKPALPGILHHHERWDGSGYPNGLSGEEISIEGRILCVADTYDAIVTTRPYRSSRSSDEAIEELRRCAGTQFDGEVVEAFVEGLAAGFPEEGIWTTGNGKVA